MLSKELGTKLTVRHISKELFPFSYQEYLASTQQQAGNDIQINKSIGRHIKGG